MLKSGVMRMQSLGLTQAELTTVSQFVTGKALASQPFPGQAYGAEPGPPLDRAMERPRWNGWGVDSSNHRFQPAEMAQLAASDVPSLKLKWAFGFAGVNSARAISWSKTTRSILLLRSSV